MALKYENEILGLKLSIDCPKGVVAPSNQNACRFIFQPLNDKCIGVLPTKLTCYSRLRKPIKHHIYFLPNMVIDRVLENKFPYGTAEHEEVCLRCNVSLYDSVGNAKKAWKHFNPNLKRKLGFTHVVEGILTESDGYMGVKDEFGHFGFYEEMEANLNSKFGAPQPL